MDENGNHTTDSTDNEGNTDFPLQDLKSIILAIDWEITDDNLADLIAQTELLSKIYENDKIIHTLLKLLKALGKYVKNQKSHAHPDTIKCLNSTYSTLEEIVLNTDLTATEREQALYKDLQQFKQLKKKVAGDKQSRRPAAAETRSLEKGTDVGELLNAVNEVRSLLITEFKSLKEQIEEIKKAL